MSNNGNSSSGSLGTSDIVSIIALIISLIAFLATLLQVLQQYYASATGYARCDAKVMGRWAECTRRVFRLYELRFEVQYEAPVIFLAPPNNQNKPVRDKPLWYVEGTPESYKETRTLLPEEDDRRKQGLSNKELIHTADNERATWVDLLSAVQRMEKESNDWQQQQYLHRSGRKTPPIFGERTLAVAVQSKTKSWDTMPSSMTKPYATTTWGHIIELAAVLGLHWKEFDRSSDRYRAEGNGFMLSGSGIDELGVVFSFQRSGRVKFEDNRIIPVHEAKLLCFGVVPTIFCDPADDEDLRSPSDEQTGLILQLSSQHEIAESLTEIGCTANTVNYFSEDGNKVGHLFPVAFELLGMLGRTLHASGSAFRMLPNPTIYNWNKKSFSMWKLLEAFRGQLSSHEDIQPTDQITKIQRDLEKIFDARGPRSELDFTVAILDALHESLDDADNYLTQKYATNDQIMHVLRSHTQEILLLMNKDFSDSSDYDGTAPDDVFGKLNDESPENKQSKFMEIYFDIIRPKVVDSTLSHRRRATTVNLDANDSSGSTTAMESEVVDIARPVLVHTQTPFDDKPNNIWCTLVFRMLCWLLLHDFHKKDVQIPKSELLGSRLPVYIA